MDFGLPFRRGRGIMRALHKQHTEMNAKDAFYLFGKNAPSILASFGFVSVCLCSSK